MWVVTPQSPEEKVGRVLLYRVSKLSTTFLVQLLLFRASISLKNLKLQLMVRHPKSLTMKVAVFKPNFTPLPQLW